MYTYHWYQWLAFFYIYCFFGWIFESTYVSLRQKKFVNRGFLRLPMLPLYGTGAVMMLWVSLPVRDNLILVYISGVFAATALEYVTGYAMERLFKVKYWDYSDQKFQLHGYICLSSSIAWGFLTILLTEVIHQPIAHFVLGLHPVLLLTGDVITSIIFCADAYESTKTALALGKSLEALAKMQEEMDELRTRIAAIREEASVYASAAREDAVERLYLMRKEAEERLADMREDTIDRLITIRNETEERLDSIRESRKETLAALEQRLEELGEKKRQTIHPKNRLGHFYRRNMLHGNPSVSSTRFAEALKELKERLE
ncbi:MAG: hypothetical protein J6D13_03260 [Clostridium sp.]|nr:hypothetical protein [Clostridium sp.]